MGVRARAGAGAVLICGGPWCCKGTSHGTQGDERGVSWVMCITRQTWEAPRVMCVCVGPWLQSSPGSHWGTLTAMIPLSVSKSNANSQVTGPHTSRTLRD